MGQRPSSTATAMRLQARGSISGAGVRQVPLDDLQPLTAAVTASATMDGPASIASRLIHPN